VHGPETSNKDSGEERWKQVEGMRRGVNTGENELETNR
jgi:hypothetical protein